MVYSVHKTTFSMIEPVTAMTTFKFRFKPDIDDVNIKSIQTLVTPAELKSELPLSDVASQTVLKAAKLFVIF